MNIKFKQVEFKIIDDKIVVSKIGKFNNKSELGFVEVNIAGKNKYGQNASKMICSSEERDLKYVSHIINNNSLSIVQKSNDILVTSVFTSYDNTDAFSVYNEITNISDKTIVIDEASSFVFTGLSDDGMSDMENLYFTKFIQSHHAECQPVRLCFTDYGFYSCNLQSINHKKISHSNVGTWSTKEALAQAIIENTKSNQYLMFQIESSDSWYYEISERSKNLYLYLGGTNTTYGAWAKELIPGEKYITKKVALAVSDNLNDLLAQMTIYRRNISGFSKVDYNMPTIYNSYMHLAWDSPTQEQTEELAKVVAKTGAEYYVIDCGWHNEEPGDIIYPYVGQWKESKARFPKGVRYITDYIRSLGMKAGLWIEPEIVGYKCTDMLEFYDDDCFYQRYGQKVLIHGRYFLDYRNPKVKSYMTETIRRMVEDYGADYIKMDCNQDCGVGNDYDSLTWGEGLEECTKAFFDWVNAMKNRFPNVVFEGCASGGMRMDYSSLSTFSLVSTSDQTRYLKYPYIAGNILSAVIPEQAAVWSYPTGYCTKEEVTNNEIIVNMVNSFLGRMHLASHLEWLSDEQLNLISEGINVYNNLTEFKRNAVPYLPLGFTRFGDKVVSAGLKLGNKICLAVWNLSDDNNTLTIPFEQKVKSTKILYPTCSKCDIAVLGNNINLSFNPIKTALFLEIELF